MSIRGQALSKPLMLAGNPRPQGMAIISAESVTESSYRVGFTLQTLKTPCKGPVMYGLIMKYTTTWFEIHRALPHDHNVFAFAYKSPNIQGSMNMTFPLVKIKMHTICNSDRDRPFRIGLAVPKKGCISMSEPTTVNKLFTHSKLKMFFQSNNKPAGEINIHNYDIEENPNFVDYLRSGWQFSLTVGIDFTASNGSFEGLSSYHSNDDKN